METPSACATSRGGIPPRRSCCADAILLGVIRRFRPTTRPRFRAWQGRSQTAEEKKWRVFIFGAGNAGALVFRCLRVSQEAYEVIGFLDDDPAKRYKTLYGCKVLGNPFNLK